MYHSLDSLVTNSVFEYVWSKEFNTEERIFPRDLVVTTTFTQTSYLVPLDRLLEAVLTPFYIALF